MDVSSIGTAFKEIATALLGLGVGLTVLSLAAGGIAMYFSWLDSHIGSLIKRVIGSVLMGSALLGGAGAIGLFLGPKFGLS